MTFKKMFARLIVTCYVMIRGDGSLAIFVHKNLVASSVLFGLTLSEICKADRYQLRFCGISEGRKA